ncbi:DeoR family transcriptional regulator, fructose operon transcriptional repressor [Microlunatus soli]|uniref:DeoR family transcriptional regulator, fructose operon transcriptional repressor n=2 Tax=Microlunatus soli TaxID=630515 RepID=A0A1H1XXV3_9ACTN|nr:DeoR family transcriptional regulator, fructose operon transcriptional repressor [Microlunatus soli]
MESVGRLQRVHGGAVPVLTEPDPPRTDGASDYSDLGRRLWGRLPRSGTLLIGTGRPALGLADAISADPPTAAGLTIVTNSLDVAIVLSKIPTIGVYNIGGTVSPQSHGQEGDWALSELDRLRVDVAVVCPAGVDAERGLTDPTPGGAAVNRAETLVGGRVIAMVDAASVGAAAFVQFATIDEIDELAIAGDVAAKLLQHFIDRGIELTVAPADQAEGRPDR